MGLQKKQRVFLENIASGKLDRAPKIEFKKACAKAGMTIEGDDITNVTIRFPDSPEEETFSLGNVKVYGRKTKQITMGINKEVIDYTKKVLQYIDKNQSQCTPI